MRRSLSWFLVSLVFAVLGFFLYSRLRPVNPAEIFVIEPVPLTAGPVTLTGTLLKDAPAGEAGQFLLILSDSQIVILSEQGLDHLLGETVLAEGTLSLTEGSDSYLTLSRIILETTE